MAPDDLTPHMGFHTWTPVSIPGVGFYAKPSEGHQGWSQRSKWFARHTPPRIEHIDGALVTGKFGIPNPSETAAVFSFVQRAASLGKKKDPIRTLSDLEALRTLSTRRARKIYNIINEYIHELEDIIYIILDHIYISGKIDFRKDGALFWKEIDDLSLAGIIPFIWSRIEQRYIMRQIGNGAEGRDGQGVKEALGWFSEAIHRLTSAGVLSEEVATIQLLGLEHVILKCSVAVRQLRHSAYAAFLCDSYAESVAYGGPAPFHKSLVIGAHDHLSAGQAVLIFTAINTIAIDIYESNISEIKFASSESERKYDISPRWADGKGESTKLSDICKAINADLGYSNGSVSNSESRRKIAELWEHEKVILLRKQGSKVLGVPFAGGPLQTLPRPTLKTILPLAVGVARAIENQEWDRLAV